MYIFIYVCTHIHIYICAYIFVILYIYYLFLICIGKRFWSWDILGKPVCLGLCSLVLGCLV